LTGKYRARNNPASMHSATADPATLAGEKSFFEGREGMIVGQQARQETSQNTPRIINGKEDTANIRARSPNGTLSFGASRRTHQMKHEEVMGAASRKSNPANRGHCKALIEATSATNPNRANATTRGQWRVNSPGTMGISATMAILQVARSNPKTSAKMFIAFFKAKPSRCHGFVS